MIMNYLGDCKVHNYVYLDGKAHPDCFNKTF